MLTLDFCQNTFHIQYTCIYRCEHSNVDARICKPQNVSCSEYMNMDWQCALCPVDVQWCHYYQPQCSLQMNFLLYYIHNKQKYYVILKVTTAVIYHHIISYCIVRIVSGKMILFPRLFHGYRGNFPAAPVESAPMLESLFHIKIRFRTARLSHAYLSDS